MSRPDAGPRKLKADSAALAASAAHQRRQQATQLSMVHRDAARWEKRMQTGAAGEAMEAPSTQVSSAQVVAALGMVRDVLGQWQPAEQEKALVAVRSLRQCAGAQGSSDTALQGGAVTLLGRVLQLTAQEAPQVAEEAVWGLNNLMVASSVAADGVLELLPLVLSSLSSPSHSLIGQCTLALGNMAMEGPEYRDRLLAAGAAAAVGGRVVQLAASLEAEEEQASTSRPSLAPAGASIQSRTLCNCLWALSQLIRGAPQHMETLVQDRSLLSSLASLLSAAGEQWLEEVTWVLVYLSAGPAAVCSALMEQRAAEVLVEQLGRMVARGVHVNAYLGPPQVETEPGRWAQQMVPLLRCAGNLVCEMSPPDAKLAYSQRLLPLILSCLQARHRGVRKEAARLSSFLPYLREYPGLTLPDSAVQLQQQVLSLLLGMLLKATFDLRKEAAFAVVAWCAYEAAQLWDVGRAGGQLLVQRLLAEQPEVLQAFLQHMRHSDVEANRLGLEFTQLVLSRVPGGPQLVEAADGIDALEQIQYHCAREELASWAGTLVDKYYGEGYGAENGAAPEPPAWATSSALGSLPH